MSVHDKTIRLLRLLLLGQLIEKTGVLWRVSTERLDLNLKFLCRYGFGRHEVLQANASLDKAEQYIDDLTNDISWDIAKMYERIMKKKAGIR